MNRIPQLRCSMCARVWLSVLPLCRLFLFHLVEREIYTGNFVLLVHLRPMDLTIVSAEERGGVESGGPESASTVDNRSLPCDWHGHLWLSFPTFQDIFVRIRIQNVFVFCCLCHGCLHVCLCLSHRMSMSPWRCTGHQDVGSRLGLGTAGIGALTVGDVWRWQLTKSSCKAHSDDLFI